MTLKTLTESNNISGKHNGEAKVPPVVLQMLSDTQEQVNINEAQNNIEHADIKESITNLKKELQMIKKYAIYIVVGLFLTGALKPTYVIDLFNLFF